MAERGHAASARRHLRRAVALDGDYADAVFNLASLEFEAGNLAEARRCWERYLELDRDSEWARTAAPRRPLRRAAGGAAAKPADMDGFLFDGPEDARGHASCSPTAPARRWIRRR